MYLQNIAVIVGVLYAIFFIKGCKCPMFQGLKISHMVYVVADVLAVILFIMGLRSSMAMNSTSGSLYFGFLALYVIYGYVGKKRRRDDIGWVCYDAFVTSAILGKFLGNPMNMVA